MVLGILPRIVQTLNFSLKDSEESWDHSAKARSLRKIMTCVLFHYACGIIKGKARYIIKGCIYVFWMQVLLYYKWNSYSKVCMRTEIGFIFLERRNKTLITAASSTLVGYILGCC